MRCSWVFDSVYGGEEIDGAQLQERTQFRGIGSLGKGKKV